MTERLRSYVMGEWIEGAGSHRPLVDPTRGVALAEASTEGIDMKAALAFARERGGPALRAMTFAERGALLAAASSAIHERREALIEVGVQNAGNTRKDAKFDIDGATATLSWYARLGEKLGQGRFLLDGGEERLSRNPRYVGRHIRVPLRGCALHINAFNFPAWGFAEKAAVAILAGVPVITKPATSTALLTARIFEALVEGGVMPVGALSLLLGGAGDLLDHLTTQDVVAFTGSSDTGRAIKGHPNVVARNVRVNIEADSVNAAVLGADVEPGGDTWDLFVREVANDMTQKAGQKCTAIRRIFAPADRMDEVQSALIDELSGASTGDPSHRDVTVGPLATGAQLKDIRAGVDRLRAAARPVFGDGGRGELVGVEGEGGFFIAPTLLRVDDGHAAEVVHAHEVFGPVATLIPYDGTAADAAELVCKGDGGLVASIYSDDRDFVAEALFGIAPYHGRVHIGSAKIADHSPGPGTVMPQMLHGGPGRAGGGEELGGLRGLSFYTQRTAVQGLSPLLEKLFVDGVEG